jgi:hypothetical protein
MQPVEHVRLSKEELRPVPVVSVREIAEAAAECVAFCVVIAVFVLIYIAL